MDAIEIRQRYLKSIEPQIKAYEKFANNIHFEKFVNLRQLYSIFFPLQDSGYKTETFVDRCDLFSWLYYCVEDDGDLSIVQVEWWSENHLFTNKKMSHINNLILSGSHYELEVDTILKAAKYHHSSLKDCGLTKFSACHFDWSFLDILETHEIYRNQIHEMVSFQQSVPNRNETIRRHQKVKEIESVFDCLVLEHIKKNNPTIVEG